MARRRARCSRAYRSDQGWRPYPRDQRRHGKARPLDRAARSLPRAPRPERPRHARYPPLPHPVAALGGRSLAPGDQESHMTTFAASPHAWGVVDVSSLRGAMFATKRDRVALLMIADTAERIWAEVACEFTVV